MTTKRMIARICICLGCLCVLVAAGLLVENSWAEQQAGTDSTNALLAIAQVAPAQTQPPTTEDFLIEDLLPQADADATQETMQTLAVDGQVYCGTLGIDALSLTLPIQETFSYPNLKSSPCVYAPTGNEALVIAAHNYIAHFGNLHRLNAGDDVCYTPIGGETQRYTVSSVTTVEETDLTSINGTADELILFTCNINNNTQRILVRCTLQA